MNNITFLILFLSIFCLMAMMNSCQYINTISNIQHDNWRIVCTRQPGQMNGGNFSCSLSK
jgi:hypothetical protein